MKMLKKLLAVVLTGAMALTLLTACGGNAVTDKSIADALNDIAKAKGEKVTFTPRAKEREMAQKWAALIEKTAANATVADGENSSEDPAEEEFEKILGIDKGGANEKNFVWSDMAIIDELGVSEQAQLLTEVFDVESAHKHDSESLKGKTPANPRYMGTALCKVVDVNDDDGKPVTVRVIVVTAAAK